ncbi:ubiquitin-protein ligase [Culex quinquefasciatus]|uniref:Ubiquitin-protein ligase n=1 Tax=Culex quinquefasciatus TaxID=7176 RepID=B0WW08_CULQU|nr:ubiquitin-protein ligase [Culex quinquefasciatus]|eukprot:XP_001861580.1 ubiquitin-protein ligase [Culex quinquefasciatus]
MALSAVILGLYVVEAIMARIGAGSVAVHTGRATARKSRSDRVGSRSSAIPRRWTIWGDDGRVTAGQLGYAADPNLGAIFLSYQSTALSFLKKPISSIDRMLEKAPEDLKNLKKEDL